MLATNKVIKSYRPGRCIDCFLPLQSSLTVFPSRLSEYFSYCPSITQATAACSALTAQRISYQISIPDRDEAVGRFRSGTTMGQELPGPAVPDRDKSRDKEMAQLNFPSDSSVPVSTEDSHGSHSNLMHQVTCDKILQPTQCSTSIKISSRSALAKMSDM